MNTAGGRLVMEYANSTALYELVVPIAPIDASPVGPTNNYLYTGMGAKVPTDAGVIQSFAGFAALWAPYYDGSWVLSLKSVWFSDGVDSHELTTRPAAPDVLGSAPGAVLTDPPLRRGFTFRSALGATQRVRLFAIASNEAGIARTVTATSGGFDSRDRMLVAYLSGVATGLVCWDGQPFPPSARAYVRFQRLDQAVAPSGLPGDYVVSG